MDQPLIMTIFLAIRKSWTCLETISYKDLPVHSLAFSADGSLLSVGFGNTLCTYTTDTLLIKCWLSAPCGLDGSTNKVIVNLPKTSKMTQKEQKNRVQLSERRQRIIQMVKAFLENDDNQLLTELKAQTKNLPLEIQNDGTNEMPLCKLLIGQKEIIFKGVLAQHNLNFFQKLELFQKIGIHICLPADLKNKFSLYIRQNMSLAEKHEILMRRSKNLGTHEKFIGHWKLQNYLTRRRDDTDLHLRNVTFESDVMIDSVSKSNLEEPMEINKRPIRTVSHIHHVVYATGDTSHFVIVCTEKRLLIWNLLTLRLHASFKLSVQHIVVDPCTSLVAAFTVFDECKRTN